MGDGDYEILCEKSIVGFRFVLLLLVSPTYFYNCVGFSWGNFINPVNKYTYFYLLCRIVCVVFSLFVGL